MKQVAASIIACLLLFMFAFSASAASITGEKATGDATDYAVSDLPRVIDNAQLFSADGAAQLESTCVSLAEEYGCDTVILTIDDLEGQSAQAYSEDYYDYGGYGVDEESSGLILLIYVNGSDREWYVTATGICADPVYYGGFDRIESAVLPLLRESEYEDAAWSFLSEVSALYEEARSASSSSGYNDGNAGGIWYDVPGYGDSGYTPSSGARFSTGQRFLICLGIGALLSLLIVLFIHSRMKNVSLKRDSDMYAVNQGLHLTDSRDIFLYSNVTKRPRPQETQHHSGGGGGASFHTGSSGRSHSGGGGKF